MASSNLKSLVLKQSTTATETVNPAALSYLYQAIKEIVDYWSDYGITQQDKDLYLAKYGLSKFIDISGAIAVTFCYSDELAYICRHVNGSSTNMSSPLSISVTSGYYLNFADSYWKAVMEDVFYKNKLSGVIVTAQIDDNKGISTQDVQAYSYTTQKYTPGENDKIDYFYGINKELYSTDRAFKYHLGDDNETWRTNKKNDLANRFDYFLFPNEENNLANIKIMDFTPFARIFEKWGKVPLLITADAQLGPLACKHMDEFWIYCPSKANRGMNPSNMMCDSDDNDGKTIFNGGAYLTTFKKMFFFVAYMNEGNLGHSYWQTPNGASYSQIFSATYFVADIWAYGGALFSQGILTQNFILVDSKKITPIVTPSNYTEEEAEEYFANAVENGVFSSWEWTRYSTNTQNFGAYVTWADGNFGGLGDLNYIVVPDDRYYYYIFSPYIRDAAFNTSGYYCAFDNKTVNNQQQSMSSRIQGMKVKYKKYSEFMQTHSADLIDTESGKYWWQCNNSLNNVINALYPEDNTSGIYNI